MRIKDTDLVSLLEKSLSAEPQEKLEEIGYKDVWDYEGGIKEFCSGFECHSAESV